MRNLGSECGTEIADSVGSVCLFKRKKGWDESICVLPSLPLYVKYQGSPTFLMGKYCLFAYRQKFHTSCIAIEEAWRSTDSVQNVC